MNGEKHEKGEMTPFQSIATAIAAQVGTGNLAGAATALIGGGPGAIFWMWVSAFLGMATIYAEAVLAQTYKTEVNGEVTGGPVYYIKAAFKGTFGKGLAALFAVFIVLALGFMGNMVQSNSIGAAFVEAFQVFHVELSPVIVGIVVAVIAAVIFLGGTKSLATVVEKIVPIMAGVYIVGSLILICMNITALPAAFLSIIEGAFAPEAVLGAGAGITVREAIRYGVARGLFSNEAGMGSTPHAHARAKAESPHHQGLCAMVSVFIDTFIVLNLTVFSVLTTGVMIYLPVKKELYFAGEEIGAYKLSDITALEDNATLDKLIAASVRLPQGGRQNQFVVVASRSHLTPETEAYIEALKQTHGDVELISSGSSIKICLVAEGKADVYPRFAPTMEWDTAAGHAIARAAGMEVYQADKKDVPLQYNKENLLNPWFIVEKRR